MMLSELSTLLDSSAPNESHEQLANYVVEFNVLNKPTAKARQLTVRHLSDLYTLDPAVPIYRVFRALWDAEKVGRPLLALLLAVARDPIPMHGNSIRVLLIDARTEARFHRVREPVFIQVATRDRSRPVPDTEGGSRSEQVGFPCTNLTI